VIENTLSVAALVPGMARENSKMSCMFLTKCFHFAQTRIFQTTFQSCKWICIPFIRSAITYICNMNEFIRYVTLHNFSKICFMAKGSKTFTAMDSHFVLTYEDFSSCNFVITDDVQTMDRKEWLCFIVWNANSPSSTAVCLHSSVIVFLVKFDVAFFLQLLVSAAIACFLLLLRCSIS
jgi:hypothetical protein